MKVRLYSHIYLHSTSLFDSLNSWTVNIHQDASYLYTEPQKLYGIWFALDDATEENGCLQFIPGSHHEEITYRFVRNPDNKSQKLCVDAGTKKTYDESKFVLEPMKKG